MTAHRPDRREDALASIQGTGILPDPTMPWRPGSRVARLRASRSYGVVLALILVVFAWAMFAPDEAWTAGVLILLQTGALVAALWTSGLARIGSRVSVAITVGPAVAAVVQIVFEGDLLNGLVAILTAVVTLATIAVIGLGVADQQEVNAQSVTGAICAYLLLGLLFTSAYGAAAVLGDGPFFAQGTDGTRSIRLYFSYVTLATLGYGDYTPAADVGRTLAVSEALAGQLYLVTVVALVVSHFGRRDRQSPSPDDAAGGDDP